MCLVFGPSTVFDYVKDKTTFNQLPAGTGTIIKGNTIVHYLVGVIPGQRTEI